MYRIILFAWLFIVSSLVGYGDDFETAKRSNWHHWRGPDANGSASTANPPLNWSEQSNVAWKAELPGRGSATPIVWGDRVFVLSAITTDRQAKPEEVPTPDPRFKVNTQPPGRFVKFVVLCFDRKTGKKLWERLATERVPHEGHHQTHSYAAGSPTTDGQYLYVSFGSFGNYCYDFQGNLIWSRDLRRLNTRLGWGEAVTPVIHRGNLLLNYDQEADSALYCLDAATGRTKWVAERVEKSTWTTPLIAEHQGVTQVILNGMTVRSYDLATGKPLWSCEGMTVNPIPSVVRVNDSVVCMSGYGKSVAFSIPLASRGVLELESNTNWRYASGTPYVPSPVLVGNRLFFTQANTAVLTMLDATTGQTVIEQERLPQARSCYASPIAAAGRVYFVDRSGIAIVLKAGDQLEVLAINRLNDTIDASPVAVGNQLYLRGEKSLYCIQERK